MPGFGHLQRRRELHARDVVAEAGILETVTGVLEISLCQSKRTRNDTLVRALHAEHFVRALDPCAGFLQGEPRERSIIEKHAGVPREHDAGREVICNSCCTVS